MCILCVKIQLVTDVTDFEYKCLNFANATGDCIFDILVDMYFPGNENMIVS